MVLILIALAVVVYFVVKGLKKEYVAKVPYPISKPLAAKLPPPVVRQCTAPLAAISKPLPRANQPGLDKLNYPHYPKCWSSNRKGEPQQVFYNAQNDCFSCVRGHQFQRNGRPC